MRLLHTSDIHLGKQFHGRSLESVHKAFLDWLLEQVQAHEVDAVVVAGDVYDVAMPPSYARKQLYDFTLGVSRRGACTVVVAGNHDSPATIREAESLLEFAGTRVVPEVMGNPDDQVLVLNRRDGTPGAVVCGVPFIRQGELIRSVAGQSQEERQRAFSAELARHYRDIYDRAVARRTALGHELPIIATGHLATVGTSNTEAMREIYIGLLSAFPTDQLPPADYIALGHIHRAMKVGGHEHIRYCGSPVPLATDELGHGKEVLLVDFEAGALKCVTPLPVPMFQAIKRTQCGLDALKQRLTEACDGHSPEAPVWIEVVIEDGHTPDLLTRVHAEAAGLPVEILRVQRARISTEGQSLQPQVRTLDDMSPLDVFDQLLAVHPEIPEADRAALRTRFEQVARDVTAGEAA